MLRLQGDGRPAAEAARQRINVGLVMFVSQALQVLVVSAGMAIFFVVFGALDHRARACSTRGSAPTAPRSARRSSCSAASITITEELLRVSGAIAAFGGVYYAIAVLTDSTYREEFLEDIVGELRETFRAADGVPPAQRFIATYLISRYSWMPSAPPSRPKPDCLTPPNGAAGLDTRPWLRPTMPVSSPSTTRNARLMSRVKT